MVQIGNFFFRYRNFLFIFLYLLLFFPSPPLFSKEYFGDQYYLWTILSGLLVTISGQVLRGATIGLAYIVRGGKGGKVYAEDLVTEGMFQHARNPLYLGNILMLLGMGILANSLLYVLLVMPVFMLIYHTIVLAEEAFLRNKFGTVYDAYAKKVNRWIPSFKNWSSAFGSRKFNPTRWLLKEYNTHYIWLNGITLILLLKYPQFTNNNERTRNVLLSMILPLLLIGYLFVRYMKKSGKWKE